MSDGYDIGKLVSKDGSVVEDVLAGIPPEELSGMLPPATPFGSLALLLARNDLLEEEHHVEDVLRLDRNEVAYELARRGRLPDRVLEEIALEESFANADGKKPIYTLLRSGRLPDCLRGSEALGIDDGLPGRLLLEKEGERPDETLRKRIMKTAETLSAHLPTNALDAAPSPGDVPRRLENAKRLLLENELFSSRFQAFFLDHVLEIFELAAGTGYVAGKALELGWEEDVPDKLEAKRALAELVAAGRYGEAREARNALGRCAGAEAARDFERVLLAKRRALVEKRRERIRRHAEPNPEKEERSTTERKKKRTPRRTAGKDGTPRNG